IEAISDPLTHLVRNAVDHGIEPPEERIKAGKDPKGTVILRAYHEAGQVNIEIADDGKGLDPEVLAKKAVAKGLITEEQASVMSDKEKVNLIFYPGFSTAEQVTDVSGRGVGMDVVKTNLDKLGGEVELDSTPGKGTTIKIKLPLTLTIIPSLLVSTSGDKYAIPQINIKELLRIPSSQVKDRIEKVGNAEVVRLRGQLLPLVRLADALDIERVYFDRNDGQSKPDRRKSIADRRSKTSPYFYNNGENHQVQIPETVEERRSGVDRRYHVSSAVNIVVVSAGPLKYGLVVDELHDSEEIVVKPLGRHIKKCRGYIGATILGDGRVALILDIPNIAKMTNLTSVDASDRALEVSRAAAKASEDIQSLVIFRNAEDEQFAIPLGLVQRIERVKKSAIEIIGNRKTIQYRGRNLPVIGIEEVVDVKPLADYEELEVIVFQIANREVGLLATGPIDVLDIAIEIDTDTLKQQGILGSTIINSQTTLLLDIYGLVEALYPSWFTELKFVEVDNGESVTVLLAEDSDFFRAHVKKFLEDEGYTVIEAEDGMVAWNILQERSDEINLVLTDLEMPNMDGFTLTEKIKTDDRYKHLPVIALTTLADEESIEKGKAAGVDDYQIKLDKERLMEGIYKVLKELVPESDNFSDQKSSKTQLPGHLST
ncbi:MAG: hybrid sensor histidine kinase/response regulator, partial [Deltaproteobacteria bacterium]